MRNIEFRGKKIDTGKWVYGFYLEQDAYNLGSKNTKRDLLGESMSLIVEDSRRPSATPVNRETIGQYTGLKDKNGKEIFEGDIIKFDYRHEENFEIVFEDSAFWTRSKYNEHVSLHEVIEICKRPNNWRIEVIGNIYDNPELLEEGE